MSKSALLFPTIAAIAGCTAINPDLIPSTDAGDPGGDSAVATDASLPTIDLALHYAFEGSGASVLDASDRERHGTLSDLAARSPDGRTGSGLTLDGSLPPTRYVDLPTGVLADIDDFTIALWVKLETVDAWARIYDIGNGLPDPTNRFMYLTPSGASGIHAASYEDVDDFTVSAWVKLESSGAWARVYDIGNGLADPANRFMYMTPAGIDGIHAASYGGSSANESVLVAGTQLPTGVWKHIALTGSGGNRTLYVDGFPATVVTGAPDVPPSEMEPIGGQSWLGRSRFQADPGFDGTLDSFRIYAKVLTQPEIAELAWPKTDYSYWRFDEGSGATAADSSDNQVATVLVDGAAWVADGRLGSALDLAGAPANQAGAHVTLGANPLADCTEELSVAAWIKLRSLDTWARVFDFGTADTAFVYLTPYDGDGVVRFAMIAPAGIIDVTSPAQVFTLDDTWHHIAVTVDAAKAIAVYVDGAVVASAVSADVGPADFTAVTERFIGKSRFPDPYLNGSIDEMRISCRAFTADEVENLAAR